MTKISVIIPVYNVEKYLRECLDSVVNQTLKDIEIICVNDGSTDNSLEILKEYEKQDSRIKIIDKKNEGAGVARNHGLQIASGKYIYFMDSDDFLDNNALEILYTKISEENADICLCDYKEYYESSGEKRNAKFLRLHLLPNFNIFSAKDIPDTILQCCATNIYTKLYCKNFITTNNIQFQNVKTCNDVYFNTMTLLMAKSICYINKAFLNYRCEQSSNLTSSRGKTAQCIIIVWQKIIKDLKKKKLFKIYKKTIYKQTFNNFVYEFKFVEPEEQYKQLLGYQKILPTKEFLEFAKIFGIKPQKSFLNIFYTINYKNKQIRIFNKNFINNLFSVRNDDRRTHKIITLLGAKIKIKRGAVKQCQK